MHISHLHLVNFKNYEEADVSLVDGINGFVGPAADQRRDMTNFDDMYGGR